jgi:hypothetical protein
MQFPIQPGPQASSTLVLAFRIWLTPYAAEFIPNAGGLHTAPLLGSASAVAAVDEIQWLQTIRVYAGKPLEALLFLLLSIFASSLILFDRTDRVYLWIGAVFFLTALLNVDVVIGSMTQLIPGRNLLLIDGIVEAIGADHQLFGFERAQQLLNTAASAADLATTAQSWGQQDDISVISVTRTSVLKPTAV